jgi:predicted amidophosphoribosyltransferase
MNRRERREKLDMTYFYREGVLETPRNVLLVDDVLTTGTTFRMCASALDDSPHRVVGTLALALA